jgi:pilus assembly protein CpaC
LLAGLLALMPVALVPAEAFAQRAGRGKADKDKEAADKDADKDKKAATGSGRIDEQQDLNLAVGETKTINVGDVKQYSEGTPGIADFRPTPDGSKFIVVGLKAGSTSLLLIKNNGTQVNWVINVFSRSPELVERELTQLLDGYTGVRVRRVGSRLFIEGGVATEADQDRVRQIADLYKGQVESLVTVGTGAIDRRLNIRVDLFFVQYTKSSGYQFGLVWPRRIGGEFASFEFGYDFVANAVVAQPLLVNQPLPGLDIAASHGWAKVMKQATVITTNGSQATFNNGGELNFPVTSGLVAGIEKVSFGTNVKVLPRYDPSTRNIEIQVDTDVSDLTPPTGTSFPGLQTSRLQTLVFLKLGQSLVISGIRTRSHRHDVQGLPLLSQIPVIGVLFGTHGNAKEEVEGAIIVVPSVVEAVDKGTTEILKEALAQYEGFSGDMDDVNTFRKTPPAEPSTATEGK